MLLDRFERSNPLALSDLPALLDKAQPMTEFVKCPCCSGHESISAEAAAALATIIEHRLNGSGESPVTTELWNIRNMILNTQERAVAIDPLLE